MNQILDLTIGQLNLLIEIIGDRIKKEQINQAIILRMAVVSSLSKEAAEEFQKVVDETFDERRVKPVTIEELSKFGLGIKEG